VQEAFEYGPDNCNPLVNRGYWIFFMEMREADFLVTGATGRTGGAAIEELLGMGKRVRALVRSDDERAAALRERGVDVALGDFTNIDALRAAMEGVSSAYFLYPIAPGIVAAAAYFAQAATEAGVTSIVNMSQISARRTSLSHAAQDHWISERVFDWSEVATTHLRPTFFADWLIYPHFAREIWTTRKIEFPFENGRHAPISSEDQGRVIANLLANPLGHAGRTYTLQGPVEMDYVQIADVMSDVLGTRIEYAPASMWEFRTRMEERYGFPAFLVQHLVEVAQNYRDGLFAGTNDVVEQITGTPALSVAAFLSKHRAAFV
jgi:NAD(P)H dehydrogenase (quinone)